MTRQNSMRTAFAIALLVAVSQIGPQARAGFIQPDTATASSEFSAGFDGLAVNTINGSGLPSVFGPSDAHASYVSGNHWTTNSGTTPTSQSIDWGFTTPLALDTIYIWNHQSTVPPANNPGYDVTLFDLTVFDATNGVLLALTDIALAPDIATAQAFSLGEAISGVGRVRFNVKATQGSTTFTGLAEVGFNQVTAVPEPSSMALIVLGLAAGSGHLVRSRRRVP